MAVELDVRDLARRRPATVRARAVTDDLPAAGELLVADDLPAAAHQRGAGRNVFTGTRSVLKVPAGAARTRALPQDVAAGDAALVEDALARVRRSLGRQRSGGERLELVPDGQVVRTSAGTAVVHLHQHYRGIPVFEAVRSVHFDPGSRGEIVGDHVTIPGNFDAAPAVSAAEAVLAAARYLAAAGAEAKPGRRLRVSGRMPRQIVSFPLPSRPSALAKRPFEEPVTAQLVWLHCGPADIRLGWLVSLAMPAGDEHYDLIVGAGAAADGEVPSAGGKGTVLYCRGSFRTARGRGKVFRHSPAAGGSSGDGRLEVEMPLPREAYPTLAGADFADPFGRAWIDRRHTRGNNTVVRRGNRRATLAGKRSRRGVVFAPKDPQGEDQRLLNAFYYCNYLHDFFALLGFGEAEGNFQKENFTGAPGDRDALVVRVFDRPVAGTARMRSRRDGRPGELHLGPRDDRHAALDADLVCHEVAHGVTNRLTGGRLAFEPLHHPESRALDEGYCDYFALTLRGYQTGEDAVTFSPWLGGDERTGLRRHAYDDTFPLDYGDLAAAENQEPHRGGEIWCAALMRMNRAIGRALGDAGRGHEIGWQLVVDSLKLLPVGADQPGFLDARDAVTRALTDLQVAGRLDPAEQATIEGAVHLAFASTGMGPGAVGRGAHFRDIVADFTGADVVLPDVVPPDVVPPDVVPPDDSPAGNGNPNDPPGGNP